MSEAHDPYASDAPLEGRDGDRLQRWPFAERIADTLATRSDPTSLVVGVYGRWGEGKTTVLRFIEQRLKDAHSGSVVVVRFNPWLFTSDTDLFLGFFAQIATAIEQQLESGRRKLGRIMKTYGGVVAGLAGGVVAGLAGLDLSKIGEELANATPDELRGRLEDALAKKKTRIVVLLDDIDRLDKNEAQAVFRLLKVAADFRWTSYVLAFDPEVVAAALSERYPGRGDGGGEFLDKIVQVPLPLPPVPKEVLRKLLFTDVDRVLRDAEITLCERDIARFVQQFDESLLHRVETPRAAKRYVNALQFALPLLKGEVDVVDLLLIEALRVFHPTLHTAVVSNSRIILEGPGNRSKESVSAFEAEVRRLVGSGEKGRSELEILEQLFPRLQSIFSNTHFGEDTVRRWTERKRIASERYFPRYFSSGVPAGDVADSEIRKLIQEAAVSDPGAAAVELRALLERINPDHLTQKLIDLSRDSEPMAALALAEVLLRVGTAFPNPRGPFAELLGARGRIALLTATLLRHVTAPKVPNLEEKLGLADLPFALLVFRRLRPSSTEDETQDTSPPSADFSEDDWLGLGERLLWRVRQDATEVWPFGFDNEDASYRLALWREFGDLDDLRSYVARMLDEVPARALDLVRLASSAGYAMGTGERFQDPLSPKGYAQLKSMFPGRLIADALELAFGVLPLEYDGPGIHVETDVELAQSYLRLFVADQAEAKPATESETTRSDDESEEDGASE